jgi:hypothetical protein
MFASLKRNYTRRLNSNDSDHSILYLDITESLSLSKFV